MVKWYTPEEMRAREKALEFWGSVKKANAAIMSFNKGVIIVCPKCRHVDIHPINHATQCDPAGEAQRQMAQEYYD